MAIQVTVAAAEPAARPAPSSVDCASAASRSRVPERGVVLAASARNRTAAAATRRDAGRRSTPPRSPACPDPHIGSTKAPPAAAMSGQPQRSSSAAARFSFERRLDARTADSRDGAAAHHEVDAERRAVSRAKRTLTRRSGIRARLDGRSRASRAPAADRRSRPSPSAPRRSCVAPSDGASPTMSIAIVPSAATCSSHGRARINA